MPELAGNEVVDQTEAQAEFDKAWDEEEESQTEDTDVALDDDPDADDEFDVPEKEEAAEPEDKGGEAEPEVDDEEQPGVAETAAETQQRKSWEGRLNKREKELNEREKALEAKPTAAATDTDEDAPGEKADPAPPKDDTEVETFKAEFDQIAGPVQKMIDQKFGQIEEQVAPMLSQAEKNHQQQQQDAEQEHFDTIDTAHSDLGELLQTGKVDEFIDSQPGYLQDAFRKVKDTGSATEIIDMLDQMKGISHEERAELNKQKDPAPSKKRERARAVPTRRTSSPRSKGKATSFDDAWDEAPD